MDNRVSFNIRFRDAEIAGKIKAWHYSYSPANTVADTRYVFTPNNDHDVTSSSGTCVLFYSEVSAYLRSIGA